MEGEYDTIGFDGTRLVRDRDVLAKGSNSNSIAISIAYEPK